ncbi:MAG: hypothetical protein ABSA21_05940 [Candidatus Limnocylindrales bacterium]|jgi:hypothetical protein
MPFDRFGPEEYELAPEEIEREGDSNRENGLRARLRAFAVRVLVRVAWLGLAVLLALGSAGIVAATGQPPQGDNRPELTYGADQVLSNRLDAAIHDLNTLNNDVVVLGQMARDVLSNLSQVNEAGLDAAYTDGDKAVSEIDAGAAKLSSEFQCATSWTSAREADLARTYSRTMIDRWHQVCVAIDSVAPLKDNWAAMENGARVAMQVADDINNHDSTGAQALQLATQGRYPEALAMLAQASASLADAQRIATNLATVGDVSTLTEWLQRSKGMDDALALLWQTMIDSNGRVTAQVTAALKAVNDAQALLPDNSDILQVVLYEMAGDLTSDGIAIETAKGQLASALADLTGGSVLGQ